MAKFFIDRPIFAWVISIFIIAAGIFGIKSLPVSQYPSVAAPTITLHATYPGASAQVMEDSVLSVIERNMNGVEGLDYMSTSADSSGSGSVSLTFTPDTDENLAQVEVQNKLSEVLSTLPATVQQYGVTVSKARSNFLMIVMLSSDVQSTEEMNDYAQRNIVPELQRIEGVGQVRLFGAQRAMRIWVDPKKLQNYNLSFADIGSALSAQNVQISAGSIGSLPAVRGQTVTATVTAQGQLGTAEEFGNVILRANTDGSNVYLKDVARVGLGMEDYSSSTRLNGVNTTGMAVMLSNSGNAMATAKAVKERMATLEKYFPQGMSWKTPYDTSKFVEISIEKVIHTLIEAMVLVFVVMYLFLQNIRYTLIPTIVVPISLLGGFAFISYMGMSINVLTMFAMVLVIGIVVDDAIVVVENVERIMAGEGLPPKEATKKAMGQISGAVIGITAVLISVFVPLAMFSGATGNIYKQFALTMASSIAFSAFLALTLTPALCATMLKTIPKGHHEEKKGFFGWFNKKFNSWTHGYELIQKMRASGLFDPSTVRAGGLEDSPQLKIDINRAAAAAQGISFADIRTALASALSSSYVSDFPNQGRLQRVMVQADEDARMQPADILNLTVPNKSGVAVPLSTIATVSWENGTEQSVRFNGYPSMKLSASPATGVSTGQAMAAVQKMVDELGGGYSLEWGGQSREEAKGGSQTLILYGLAVAAVFLVLAALYESWSIPLAVILVIPLGLIGAAAGVTGRNLFEGLLGSVPSFANDIYFQVGFVTVMGLSAKNAILIIEFAKDLQAQGKSAVEAALEAARLRFRPIIMTSFAFILGVVPLYIAGGASSASQRAIGTTVFWGMLIGTLLSVFLVPLFYVVVRKFFKETAYEHEMAIRHASEAGITGSNDSQH